MTRFAVIRERLPAVFLLLALAAALFVVIPGGVDAGAARAAAVLAFALLALWSAFPALAARPMPRAAAAVLLVAALAVVVSVLRSGDVAAAFWGRQVLWTASGSLLLALVAAMAAAPAARSLLPAGIAVLLTIHQSILTLRLSFPTLPLGDGVGMSLGAATPSQAAMLSVPALVLSAAALIRAGTPLAHRLLWGAAAAVHLLVLVRLDRGLAWAVLGVGLVVLLAYALRRFDQLWRPATNAVFALAAVSVVLAVVRLPAPFAASLPLEVDVRPSAVAAALPRVWRADPAAVAVGTGPGTFLDTFGRVRPATLNGPALWNVRFPAAPTTLLQWLSDIGLIGTVAFLAVAGLALSYGMRALVGLPAARGLRRSFARRAAAPGDPGLVAAGMTGLVAALLAAVVLRFVPPAGLLTLALGVGWLIGARPEGEKTAKPADGRRALLLGWAATTVLVAAALAAGAALWFAVAGRSYGALLSAQTTADAEAAYQATLDRLPPEEIHAVGALVALTRAGAGDDPSALDDALTRARLAAASERAALLETAVTVGMRAAGVGVDVPELEGWIARARALEPNNPTFAIALGDLRQLQGDVAGAEEAYREAVRLAPAVLAARGRLVASLLAAGRTDEALTVAEEGVRAAPLDAGTLDLLAGVLVRRGGEDDLLAAESVAGRAVQLLGGDPAPLIRIAELLERQGNLVAARRWYEAAATLAPGNRELLERIDRLADATSTPAEVLE